MLKSKRVFRLALILSALFLGFGLSLPTAHASSLFSDIYSESLYQDRTHTVSAALQTRLGWQDDESRFQLYTMGQIRGDNNTLNNSYSQIFNDNYAAIYGGFDWVFLPGIRFRSQLGVSKDLSSKIQLQGLELNVGFITYHELPFSSPNLHGEVYTEELYFRRYRNFIPNGHVTVYYDVVKWGDAFRWSLGPSESLKLSFDSKGLNYNRFMEEQTGLRFQVRTARFATYLNPQYVFGQNLSDPPGVTYPEFRVLWVLGWYL